MAQTAHKDLIIQHFCGQPAVDVVAVFKAHPEVGTLIIIDEEGELILAIDSSSIDFDSLSSSTKKEA
jgi:hypothetical protein